MIFNAWAKKVADRKALIAKAEAVGDVDDILELGIEAAKLGLRAEDLGKMARLYLTLGSSGLADFDLQRATLFLKLLHEAG